MKATTNSSLSSQKVFSAGFTLIELMVTIAVLAIIVTIAAPSISTQLANQRVKSTTATLVNALKEARVESVIRRQSIKVSYDDDDYIIMIEVNDGSNNDEIAVYNYNPKSIIDGDNDIEFKPNKTVDDDEIYTICDTNQAATHRQITVSELGNVSVKLGGSC